MSTDSMMVLIRIATVKLALWFRDWSLERSVSTSLAIAVAVVARVEHT